MYHNFISGYTCSDDGFLDCIFRFGGFQAIPETNSELAPENGWLEDDSFPFGMAYFLGRAVSFREGRFSIHDFDGKFQQIDD